MSDPIKNSFKTEQAKKPIALAIVLVLLVISLIFVILYASKSIGYQQTIQVITGENIVKQLKVLDKKLTYAEQGTAELIDRSSSWNNDAALLSLHVSYLLEDVNGSLIELFEIGKAIDNDRFNEMTDADWTSWTNDRYALLTELSSSEVLTAEQLEQLESTRTTIVQLLQIVQQFNFKLEGNKNAMIRLSSGFDWIELADQLNAIVNGNMDR